MLEATNIDVSLSGTHIVKNVALRARAGEFTSIIGPNGSGKTTLMRALSGEIRFSGNATMSDMQIASTSAREMAAWRGVLPQSVRLSFPFTVHEVVRLGLSMGIHDPANDNLRVQEALEAVDLVGFSGRYYQELSGGEAQRVQLARVLAQVWEPVFDGRPRYLFLDEPISSLDIKHQVQILSLARKYAKAGGCVIAVLHDLNLTAHFSDHVYLIQNGEVFAQGDPREVMTKGNLETVYDCPMRIIDAGEKRGLTVMPLLSELTSNGTRFDDEAAA